MEHQPRNVALISLESEESEHADRADERTDGYDGRIILFYLHRRKYAKSAVEILLLVICKTPKKDNLRRLAYVLLPKKSNIFTYKQ